MVSPQSGPTPRAQLDRKGSGNRPLLDAALSGLSFYVLTSVVVFLGAGAGFVIEAPQPGPNRPRDFIGALAYWDGGWFRDIVNDGYSYDPQRRTSVAFFPLYPLAAAGLRLVTGARTELALLIVSNACLAAAFVVVFAYVRERSPQSPKLAGWVSWALGFYPAGLFLRLAYSESLLLLLLVLTLYGIQRRWRPLVLAGLVGLATATRPVGAALLIPLAIHLWQRRSSTRQFVLQSLLYLPLGCWGIAAFMVYLYVRFDDPLAFAVSQYLWNQRPAVPLMQRMFDLATLEPVWRVFDPQSPGYWARQLPNGNPLFSLTFANPIYFLLALGLVALGAAKRWLNGGEWSLALALLLIPYATRGHEMIMLSTGRFVCVAFPVYLVAGRLLYGCRPLLGGTLLLPAAFLLAAYAFLFGAGYYLI